MNSPFEPMAQILRTLADTNRLLIIERLAQGPSDVEGLSARTGLVYANLSHHLQILKRVGLLKSSKSGRKQIYRLAGPSVIQVQQALRHLQDEILGPAQTHPPQDAAPRIDRQRARDLLRDGKAVFLDVRPEDEFRAGHIPASLHIPLEELPKRLSELPRDRLLIAYCRGPFCQLQFQAEKILGAAGFNVAVLHEGFPEWWAEGLPVESED